MWNLKRLPSNVFSKINCAFKENVRMASKKPADEKPKATKKGFFRRSESAMPDYYEKNMPVNEETDADDKKIIHRSSMICSEGFDKYTFDCHKRDIPSRSVGFDLDTTGVTAEPNNSQNSLVPDSVYSAQSPKSGSVEHSVRKPILFKSLSISQTPVKNAPFPFKRVLEEVIPANIPLSYKRVPEETIPVVNHPSFNITSVKTPVTNIPLSFSSIPEGISSVSNSANKASSQKSAPVRSSPFSFSNVYDESSLVRNSPLSFKHVPEKKIDNPISYRNAYLEPPVRNTQSMQEFSDHFIPERKTPLSIKHVPDEDTSSTYSPFQNSNESTSQKKKPLSLKFVPFKNKSVSSKSTDFPNKPTSPVRNIPLSFPEEPMPARNSPLSFKDVPDESFPSRNSKLSFKDVLDEPIPSRNSPLSLRPILSKHMSFLKKNPSVKGNIIKRDSVVHPGRIDIQGSLCIDGRFQNPWPTWRPPTFTNILKFGVTRNRSKVPPKQELDLILPIVKQNFSKLSIPDDGIRVTWIGHSTVLLQMHGLNILTDPIFSDRASPSQVVGPKRYRDPPCSIHDLPPINAVVISHSHYDHLDYNTVTLLNARFGAEIRWFVPLGLQTWMHDVGCENVVELDWWEENCVPEHSDTFFIFTPAQHWSKRTIGDDNKVLWGSWCILGPKYKFFFAGDTGYCDVFKQIGRVHGPFDISAIPIGAYEPRWFMKYQHINPEEAVKIHVDVKSKRSLAIHWGTFCLANEYYLDPPVKLREGLDKYEIPPELFFTLKHGQSKLIAQNNLVKRNTLE